MKKIIILFSVLTFVFSCGFRREPVSVKHSDTGLYIVRVNTKNLKGEIVPYVSSDKRKTTKEVYDEVCPKVIINGGYFDMDNGNPISYVIIDSTIVDTPFNNPVLSKNIANAPYRDNILNRAEFRVYDCDGKTAYDITNHNNPVPECCKLKHSIQAGPMLLPSMDLESEYFITTKNGEVIRQSADVLKRRPRTIIGIKGKDVYLVLFTDRNAKTIQEARDYCKKMRFEKAMGFDGGGSTSLTSKEMNISAKESFQRPVRSFLMIK